MAVLDKEESASPSPPPETAAPKTCIPSSAHEYAPAAASPAADTCIQKVDVLEKDASFTCPVEPSLPSFRQESYLVADLKECEKKALEELKLKIEESIKANDLLSPPSKNETAKEVDAIEDSKVAESEIKAEKEDGDLKEREISAVAVKSATVDRVEGSQLTSATEPSSKTAVEAPAHEPAEATRETSVEKDATPLEEIKLWGVPLLHTKGDERTNVVLLKFLRARDFKVNEAFTMLRNTMRWRSSFGVDELANEDFGDGLDGLTFTYGYDKQGYPVSYNVYGVFQDKELYQKAFGDDEKIGKFLRWRIRVLEDAIKQLDFTPSGANSFVQITDLKNAPAGRKEIRSASKQGVELLQDNYPEFVKKKVFINAPWYFSALYSIFSPFLTQRTKSKLVIARSGKVTEALFKLMSPAFVPVQYGGLGRPGDSEFKGSEDKCSEVFVKSGEKYTIEIVVSEGGATVLWDLTVVGWNVIYSSEYNPLAEGGYTTIIDKSKKITSSELPIRNSFKATEPGKVVIALDNSSSRKKKIAVYRYIVKRSSE